MMIGFDTLSDDHGLRACTITIMVFPIASLSDAYISMTNERMRV